LLSLKYVQNHKSDSSPQSADAIGVERPFEAEHYKASMDMAEISLLPAVRAAKDAPLIANGFSCRHQIHNG
jgi:hypothetical protein